MKNSTRIQLPPPETLYASAFYLATRCAQNVDPAICRMIARQFECIAGHPDPAVTDMLRETCRRLQADWERIGAERERAMRKAVTPDEDAPRLH